MQTEWFKSTKSGNNGNCVEVKQGRGFQVHVRDSKDPNGPVLNFNWAEWQAFIAAAKDGEFDL